jgi:hypothetical protein
MGFDETKNDKNKSNFFNNLVVFCVYSLVKFICTNVNASFYSFFNLKKQMTIPVRLVIFPLLNGSFDFKNIFKNKEPIFFVQCFIYLQFLNKHFIVTLRY